MRWKDRTAIAALPLLALASCGSTDGMREDAQRGRPEAFPPAPPTEPIKIGEPYQISGQSYTPSDQSNYDEVGYASWYGDELAGNKTGNGEAFNPDGITAAHRTLPMPSFAEVTNLDTGRTILVRINDRGPFSKDRIIDLSKGAAKQLGVAGQGHFPVRVRRVNPPEHERAALTRGEAAAERLETPPALLNALRKKLGAQPIAVKPDPAETAAAAAATAGTPAKPVKAPAKPVAKPAPKPQVAEAPKPLEKPAPAPAAKGSYYVQVGAFSSAENASRAAKQVGGSVTQAGKFWRVRTGPFETEASAKAALGPVAAKGYRDARITR